MRPRQVLPAVAAAMLGVAAFAPNLPYGFFTAQRWVVVAATAFCLILGAQNLPPRTSAAGTEALSQNARNARNWWVFAAAPVLVALSLVFNPIKPVYFHASVWKAIDLAALIVLAACSYNFGTAIEASQREDPIEDGVTSADAEHSPPGLRIIGKASVAAVVAAVALAWFMASPVPNSADDRTCQPDTRGTVCF
jgi:hypothetical protein